MIINDSFESYILKKIESLCNFNYLYKLIEDIFYKNNNNHDYEILYTQNGLDMILTPSIPSTPSTPSIPSTPSTPSIPSTPSTPSTPSPTLSNWQCEICKTFNTFKESTCIDCQINPSMIPFMREIIDEILVSIEENQNKDNNNYEEKVTIIPATNIYESDDSINEWEHLDKELSK